jgi:hypothetical protein
MTTRRLLPYLLNRVLSELCDGLKEQLLDPLMHGRSDCLMHGSVTAFTHPKIEVGLRLHASKSTGLELKPGCSQGVITKIAGVREFTVWHFSSPPVVDARGSELLMDEPDGSRTVGDGKRSETSPKQVQAADEEQ